tara:strand:- start:995 stop:1927 length:933 start_codon:yes stop_codon:yes gene_type:complete
MSNLVLKNKSSKKEILIFISIFIIGSIFRIGFGLFDTSDDLIWYVDPYPLEFDYIQVSRFGFPKELLFLPLKIFNSINIRIIFIGLLTSFLNTISIYFLVKNSNQRFTIYIGLIAILTIFFAKIDMHLVRQQISIYFFVISICQNKLNIKSIIFALLSIVYHEAIVFLFGAFLISISFNRFSLNNLENKLFLSSIITNTIIYLMIFDVSIIFLILVSTMNRFLKTKFKEDKFGNSFYIFQLFLPFFYLDLNLEKYLIPTEIAIQRFIGFAISYGFLILIGNEIIEKKNFKRSILITFLLSYILKSTLDII